MRSEAGGRLPSTLTGAVATGCSALAVDAAHAVAERVVSMSHGRAPHHAARAGHATRRSVQDTSSSDDWDSEARSGSAASGYGEHALPRYQTRQRVRYA